MSAVCITFPPDTKICIPAYFLSPQWPPGPDPRSGPIPDPWIDIKGISPKVVGEIEALARIHSECENLSSELASKVKATVEAGISALNKDLPVNVEFSIEDSRPQ